MRSEGCQLALIAEYEQQHADHHTKQIGILRSLRHDHGRLSVDRHGNRRSGSVVEATHGFIDVFGSSRD
jgi:hypothetical protein